MMPLPLATLIVSPHDAGRRVREARDLAPRVALTGELLPPLFQATAAAVDAGEITLAHAAVIRKFRTELPGAVDAEHGREFARGGDAVAGAKITGVDECAQLIAELDVQRDVGFWLEMHWEHCLSP